MSRRRSGVRPALVVRVAPVALVVLAILSTSCGGDGESRPATSSAAPGQTELVPDTATPQYGGQLVYGIEADTANPWVPQRVLCTASCDLVLRAVFDPLVAYDANGEIAPVLAERITHSEDFTQWTIRVRPGISFTDGTPLDADALIANFERVRTSPTLALAARDVVAAARVDDRTVRYEMARPWVAFEHALATQIGFVASPTWLDAVDRGTAEPDEPVGTGPFVFESYEPGGSFVATRNEDYWRRDARGRPLPYLDQVEFKVFEDVQSRVAALVSGQADVIHTADGDQIVRLREQAARGEVQLIENSLNAETNYLLLNVGDPESPLHDVRVRRAMAMAVDPALVNASRMGGAFRVANGPFPPGVAGHLDDTGFPAHDPDRARALVEEYEADEGPITFRLTTTSDTVNTQTAALLQQLFDEVGMDVSVDQRSQGEFVLDAATGNFDAFTFRNLAVVDPDQNNVFWSSSTAAPLGQLGVNLGRIRDEVIDGHLDTLRENPDPDARRAAAEAISRRFGRQVYNLWLTWGEWAVAASPSVHQLATGYNLPDGGEALGIGVGSHPVSQTWMEQTRP